jgi:hypothetical protein
MASVQQQWDKERAAQEAAYALAQEEARAKEQALQANADAIRQEKDREIRNLNARATALVNSLRDRSERPSTETSTLPSTARSCSGASGAELARGDGEFLAGYGSDAEKLQIALNQCIQQYKAVRDLFKASGQ